MVWGAALEATVKVGPARCLTGVRVALALVANPIPLLRLNDVGEKGGGIVLVQVVAEEEQVEAVRVRCDAFKALGGMRRKRGGLRHADGISEVVQKDGGKRDNTLPPLFAAVAC